MTVRVLWRLVPLSEDARVQHAEWVKRLWVVLDNQQGYLDNPVNKISFGVNVVVMTPWMSENKCGKGPGYIAAFYQNHWKIEVGEVLTPGVEAKDVPPIVWSMRQAPQPAQAQPKVDVGIQLPPYRAPRQWKPSPYQQMPPEMLKETQERYRAMAEEMLAEFESEMKKRGEK